MSQARSILIIGGGVIGLCTAYYSAQRGHSVTVLDRKGGASGCSHGNAGMIVPSHFIPLAAPGMVSLGLRWMWNPESPFYIRPRLDPALIGWAWKFFRSCTIAHTERCGIVLRDLSLASRQCFEELSTTLNFDLVKRGLVMLCKTREALHHESETAASARALGLAAETLDANDTQALLGGVTLDVAGGVYFPQDCHLSPTAMMQALTTACRQAGVHFIGDTEATGWVSSETRIEAVKTSRGDTIEASEFVVCGGAWSPQLLNGLRIHLPIQAGKGYSLTLQKPCEQPAICGILTEARVAMTPMGSTLRFGGTMEIAGLHEDISKRRVRGIIKSIPRYLPAFEDADFHSIQPWVGLRPCSPDGMPYIGRFARYENLSTATGHGMMGISLGPITGKIMSAILSGEKNTIGAELTAPDRFA